MDIFELAAQHPIKATLFAIVSAAVAYVARETTLFFFRKLTFSVTVTLGSSGRLDIDAYRFYEWLRAKKFVTFSNNIAINEVKRKKHQAPGFNKTFRSDDQQKPSGGGSLDIGYGTHYFWEGGLVRVTREVISESEGAERLTLTAYRGYRKVVLGFLAQIEKEDCHKANLNVYFVSPIEQGAPNACFDVSAVRKRPLSSVVLRGDVKESIMSRVRWFFEMREWFKDRFIPYRYGILLYGPPGTGKTSIAKAIASELDKDLYTINLSSVESDSRLEALLRIPPIHGSVLLLEDIDATVAATVRKDEDDLLGVCSKGVTLSGLLNALDGAYAPEGRLLLLTTNHPERLDPALVRPGRVDQKVLIDNADSYQVYDLATRFFPDEPLFALEVKARAENEPLRAACEWQSEFMDRARTTTFSG